MPKEVNGRDHIDLAKAVRDGKVIPGDVIEVIVGTLPLRFYYVRMQSFDPGIHRLQPEIPVRGMYTGPVYSMGEWRKLPDHITPEERISQMKNAFPELEGILKG